MLQLCMTAASGVALLYSIALNCFRYSVYEDHGMVETGMDLVINASPLAIALLMEKFCSDEIICNVCSVCLVLICMALYVRSYRRAVVGIMFDFVDLTGKVYIVTGSNTGIGFSTAQELARMGATVVLACRSKDKAMAARAAIIDETKCSEGQVLFIPLDLCSMKSIRRFVDSFNEMRLPLHCLINNAGMMTPKRRTTEDGYEMVFTANHLGHFLLTTLLLENLEKAGDGRVVVVSSALHHLPKYFDFDNIMSEKEYHLFGTYGQSKLANLLFARELNTRLRRTNSRVTVNSVHPGCVITDFTRSFHIVIRTLYAMLYPVVRLFQKVPLEGACSSVFAATSTQMEGVSGEYLFHCRPYPLSPAAKSDEAAKRLWEESVKLVNDVQ